MAAKLAKSYKLSPAKLKLTATAPQWFREAFPVIIKSIYDGFNDSVEKMVTEVNDSIEFMQTQINDLHKLTTSLITEVLSLKESLKNKQFESDEQASIISDLKNSIDKNESYSRRDNLIFTGFNIHKDDKRQCSDILREDVFIKHLSMSKQEADSVKFVRCHFLSKKPGMSRVSLIARFESYQDRTVVWNKRRSVKDLFISEDFPIEINKRRNKLRPILKEASKHSQYAHCISLKADKLLFNGELLTVDDIHQLPVEINPRTISEVRTAEVLLFGGINSDRHELSNFYQCPIEYKKKQFNCVEQAYQHSKAVHFGDLKSAAAILRSKNPGHQKFLSHRITGFKPDQWNTVKEDIMKDIVHCKFSQHRDIAEKLCSTGDLHIGEAIMNGHFYGIGMSLRDKSATDRTKWKQNKLGILLMTERSLLKNTVVQ